MPSRSCPSSEPTEVLVTKEWKIPPDLIPRTPGAGGAAGGGTGGSGLRWRRGRRRGRRADATKGGTGIADRESAKNWLIANGVHVQWRRLRGLHRQEQPADRAQYAGSTRPHRHDHQQRPQGNGPVQVEIESKFVEIQQNNLKELAFDWLVGQFNFPGTHNVFAGGGTQGTAPALNSADFPFVAPGTGPVGSTSGAGRSPPAIAAATWAISANAIDALALPHHGSVRLAPAIGAISGVFTDPQFQVVIRALNQKKGVDLLSSPKVTTKSGQRAVIEIIREFRYPTEFTPPQIPQTFNAPTATSGAAAVAAAGAARSRSRRRRPRRLKPATPASPSKSNL